MVSDWKPSGRNWWGLRCVLRCCPCRTVYVRDLRQSWIRCVICGWPRLQFGGSIESAPAEVARFLEPMGE